MPKSPRSFNEADDELLIRLRARGMLFRVIADHVGHPTGSCHKRYDRLMEKLQPPPVSDSTRACLRCRRAFPSEGPGNRLCPDCKTAVAGESPQTEGVSW